MGDQPGGDAQTTDKPKNGERPAPEQQEASPERAERRRSGRLNRFFLGRTGVALAAALAGLLLGAGTMAWQTDAPPFFDEQPCWGALTGADIEELPLGQERIITEELPPRDPSATQHATCRLTGHRHGKARRNVTIRVHTPGGNLGRHLTAWPEKFLLSDMVPLGHGLPGMASHARSWILLPEGCGWSSDGRVLSSPMLVDVDTGSGRIGYHEKDGSVRKALARVAVHAANATMERMGCETPRYEEPAQLAPVPQKHDARTAKLCGIEGMGLPEGLPKGMAPMSARHNGGTDGPARVCVLGPFLDDTRFATIANPALADLFFLLARKGVLETQGYGRGRIGPALSVIWAPCKGGHRAFILRQDTSGSGDALAFARAMFPDYVAAEAERLGCGDDVSVTLPEGDR